MGSAISIQLSKLNKIAPLHKCVNQHELTKQQVEKDGSKEKALPSELSFEGARRSDRCAGKFLQGEIFVLRVLVTVLLVTTIISLALSIKNARRNISTPNDAGTVLSE